MSKVMTLHENYFSAIEAWKVTDNDQKLLLNTTELTLSLEWTPTMVKRAVYVSSIYNSLHVLFYKTPDQADVWVHRKNTRFDRKTAYEIMLNESDGLERVAKYLKAMCV